MKHGLVLEGGALRGLYSMGIVDVLMDEGIVFDGAVGVSAGAALGCNIKSGQVGRALRYNMRFAKDWRYCSVRSLFLTGDLYGAEYAYHKVPKEMDLFDIEAFNANGLPFGLSARMWRRARLSITSWTKPMMRPMSGYVLQPRCLCAPGLLRWEATSFWMVASQIVFRWRSWRVRASSAIW